MKLGEYFKDTRNEMKHVNWPSKQQAVQYSVLVISLSVVTALVLALADYVFSLGIEKFLFN